MEPFSLGQEVYIKRLGKKIGQIIGIWLSLYGEASYLVRYAAADESVREFWLQASELEATEKKN